MNMRTLYAREGETQEAYQRNLAELSGDCGLCLPRSDQGTRAIGRPVRFSVSKDEGDGRSYRRHVLRFGKLPIIP